MDMVVEGRAFVNGELRSTSIGIEDGKIAAVGRTLRRGDRNLDLGDRIILPGFVDPHVHLRDPGLTEKEDFRTGTMAAVHGGVTCVLDMPNTLPPAIDVGSVTDKKAAIRSKACADYGLLAAITERCRPDRLAPLVVGFKLFMGSTTGNILMNDDSKIAPMMAEIAGTGKRVSVHAEDDSMISKESEGNNQDHLRNRPVEAEFSALRRLSAYRGMKVNICHVTDSRTLSAAADLGFTTEVTLHHMFFDAEGFPSAEHKVNPPLRDIGTRDALYRAFLDGRATMFGTDHAPHTVSEKSGEYGSAPGGIPGVETSMPIMMNLVRKGAVPLSQIVRMGSSAPAEAFGLSKGRIAPGYDADLAVFDSRTFGRIDLKKLYSKAGHTPYEGWEAVFPEIVMVRGETQVEDGEFCGDHIGEDVCG